MTASPQFPAPVPADPEDVAWTLQTAGTMWARGDHQEAIRWLRRAAEAASEAGDDLRAVSLARAAADLTTGLSRPPSVAPGAPPGANAPPAPPRPPVVERVPITPLDDVDTSHDHTIPDAKAFVPPRAPPALDKPRTPPPPPSRSGPSAAPPPSRSGPSAAPPPSRSGPSAAPPPSRSGPSAAPPASRQSPSVAPAAAFRPRQALRVAVTPSEDDRMLLSVRVLLDGEAVPDGAHEALLTALEAGAHLLSRKR